MGATASRRHPTTRAGRRRRGLPWSTPTIHDEGRSTMAKKARRKRARKKSAANHGKRPNS
ncbi:50S ribosomal protein bL37 [Pilimelia columellifera]|uniref:50S ribosomal protein bL37 n=1 Tax=Pilimelia columellifera TaxID=706574 RepID=UPI003CD0B3FF